MKFICLFLLFHVVVRSRKRYLFENLVTGEFELQLPAMEPATPNENSLESSGNLVNCVGKINIELEPFSEVKIKIFRQNFF